MGGQASTCSWGHRVNALRAAAVQRSPSTDKLISGSRLQEVVLQLPLWKDEFRCFPNEICRSSLFNARNRKQKREYLKQAEIAVVGDGRIQYTGEELRQDDGTIWFQLLQVAKEHPLGQTVEFTPYAMCKAIRWPMCKGSYERLRASLSRMQATSLSIYSARLKEGVSLSMIPVFAWRDENEQALKKYRVQIAPQLMHLFRDVHYTQVEWSQRLALPAGIATWLHSYFSSHRQPYPIKLETIKKGAGITTRSPSRVRQLITGALADLVDVRFLESWGIVGELVHVTRKK